MVDSYPGVSDLRAPFGWIWQFDYNTPYIPESPCSSPDFQQANTTTRVVPFICTVAFSEPMWTATNLHALPMNDISVNIIVYHSFMFIPCQGNAWKPYKLREFWVGFLIFFFHQFYNLVWSKSNVLVSRPLTLILLTWRIWRAPNNASKWQMKFNSEFKGLKYLCNGRAMDDSSPFLNSSCSMLLFLMQAKTDWMIQTWEHENLGRI